MLSEWAHPLSSQAHLSLDTTLSIKVRGLNEAIVPSADPPISCQDALIYESYLGPCNAYQLGCLVVSSRLLRLQRR